MQGDHISEHRIYGGTIVERLAGLTVPAALDPVAQAFIHTHATYEAACVAAELARGKRDAALKAIGDTDAALDDSVDGLADALVGAKLGKRANPFADFSKRTPAQLEKLAVATEAAEVLVLCKAIEDAHPPAAVTAATATCRANAAAVTAALQGLTQPQQAYATALAARDALLPDWTRARSKLEKHAAVAWEDSPGTADALLAPPEGVQAPTKHRK